MRSRQRVLEMLGFVGSYRSFEIDDKPSARRLRTMSRIIGFEKLNVRVVKAFSRIGSRHEVGMIVFAGINFEDFELTAGVIRICFFARQTLEWLSGIRLVVVVFIQKTEHLIEGTILQ